MENYKWTASREKDNFYYTQGQKIFFKDKCNNSLVISNRAEGEIEGIKDHAFMIEGRKSKVIPISEIEEIFFEGLKILKRGIFYLKPLSIMQIENLPSLSEEEIKSSLERFYEFPIKKIKKIEDFTGKKKVYLIQTQSQDYILKYRGKNKSIFGERKEILESCSFFPRLMYGKDSELEVNIRENFYTLEEFLTGTILSRQEKGYFDLVGKNIALMHNELNSIMKEPSSLRETNLFNESNFLSINFDLNNIKERINPRLILEAYLPFENGLLRKIPRLSNQIIHGDLNNSNIIWNEDSSKIIDTDTLSLSKRIKEFIPILLFKENFDGTEYLKGSMKEVIQSYDLFAKEKLTQLEKSILPYMLRLTLVKLYTIYNIRRNNLDRKFEEDVINNLKLIGGLDDYQNPI